MCTCIISAHPEICMLTHQNVFIFVCVSSVVWLLHDIYK